MYRSLIKEYMKSSLIVILFLISSNLLFAKKLEVVFCVDFSGSTNGVVIELQKTIWATMNQLESEEYSEHISFGLVGYGRKSFRKENYYSKIIHRLGSSVNDIGNALVGLQVIINSCEAYPQNALDICLNDIKWSKENGIKKIIVFIGNGEFPLKNIEKGLDKILRMDLNIRPIFYQPISNKLINGKESWEKFAKLVGSDLIIAQPVPKKVSFKKYYDEEFILSSGAKLMSTYLPYGLEGKRQVKQLNKMFKKLKDISLENFEEMLVYQSSKMVQGKCKWDLVDRLMSGELFTEKLNKDDLPFFLQSLSSQQLINYVNIKLKERKIIVSKLRLELDKRNEYINRKQQKSKYMEGKGGLNNIISIMLKDELE